MLDLDFVDHHDLTKLGERVANYKLISRMSQDKHPNEMRFPMQCVFLTLAAACVKHTEVHCPDRDITEEKNSLVLLGVLTMPAAGAGAAGSSAWAPGMVPPPPPWPNTAAEEESASKKNKAKGNKHFDWDEDGEWRRDAKLPHDPVRERGIKVKINEPPGWAYLASDAKQAVLQFYDRAQVWDSITNIKMPDDRTSDYRFEGGHYMSQFNPTHPTRRRREVHVVYVAPQES